MNTTAISPEYLDILEQKYAEATRGAATDAEIIDITNRLIEQTETGMVWDEQGNTQHIMVDSRDYWNAQQIEAEASLSDEQPSKTAQIVSGIFIVVVLAAIAIYLFSPFGGTSQDELIQETVVAAAADGAENVEIFSVELLGNEYGSRVEVGQPASLEIGGATFSIANAKIQNRTLPVFDPVLNNELVAEWVVDTTVNRVFGLPQEWFSRVSLREEAIVRTDTGATLRFICTEKRETTGQETEIFLQHRPGITLFPIPAKPDELIPIFWCPYNPSDELAQIAGGRTYSLNEQVSVGDVSMVVEEIYYNQSVDGHIQLDVYGHLQDPTGNNGMVFLTLNTPLGKYSPEGDRYQATTENAKWLASFPLPSSLVNTPIQLEARSPLGGAALFDLGTLPNPLSFVDVDVLSAHWNNGDVLINTVFTNTGAGTVAISSNQIQAVSKGGDSLGIFIENAQLPLSLSPGNSAVLAIQVRPNTNTIEFIVNNQLWEIENIPGGN